MNPLWSDILAQGSNIQHVIQHLLGEEKERLIQASQFIDPHKPTLLIGITSAAYLCWPAQVYLSQAGFVVRVMDSADALYHEWAALKNANVVINSRSGETAEIVKLASRLQDESIPFLAITNEPESTLAHKTDCLLWANTRKDDLVSINVITGMMLTTLVWAAAVRGELEQMHILLQSLPVVVQETLERTVKNAGQLANRISGWRPVYLLARGPSQGAALCGRLVLEEIARQPAVAIEAAEFRQGPNEVIDEHFGAVVFIGGGETMRLTRALVEEIHQHGGQVLSVGVETAVRALPGLTFTLPDISAVFLPLLEVIPMQGLAYSLAVRRGIAPGTVRYISKIIKDEAGEQK